MQTKNHRFPSTLRKALIMQCLGASFFASSAYAQPVSSDLGIQDETSFQTFRDALYKSEYVRVEYALDPNQRIVASITALMVFATQNPEATPEELASFLSTYNSDIETSFAHDTDLLFSSNFLQAVKGLDRGSPSFDGTGLDTRVSNRMLEVLDVSIPAPFDFQSTQRRMVKFETARLRSFTDSPEWSLILLLAFKGQDLDGLPNPALPGIVESYLVSEDFDPAPINPNDEVFGPVTGALATMPADFGAYSALLNDVNTAGALEDSVLSNNFESQFAQLTSLNSDKIVEIMNEMDNPPTLHEAVANGEVESIIDDGYAAYVASRAAASDERASLNWNTLVMLQSSQESARLYSSSARTFTQMQLETNDTLEKVKLSIGVASSAAQLAIAIKKKEPADIISNGSDLIVNSLDLADAFGAFDSPPSPEEQIFAELQNVRQAILDVQNSMNERFDNIEVQLNTIFTQINLGFDQIGDDIADLQFSVDAIALNVIEIQSSLERLEDALYGLASDALWADLAIEVDLVLNFRSNGIDLPYGPGFGYVTSQSGLMSFCVSHAGTEAYAGPEANELVSFDDALAVLDGESLGLDLNNLRRFPLTLGLPALYPAKVVGVKPWVQGASVYAQLAKENPWYFGYLYESQIDSQMKGDDVPDINAIIQTGEVIKTMIENGRDAELFEHLLDGYDLTVTQLSVEEQYQIDLVQDSIVPPNGIPGSAQIDLYGPLTNNTVRTTLPNITQLTDTQGNAAGHLPMQSGSNSWNIFKSRDVDGVMYGSTIVPLAYALVNNKNQSIVPVQATLVNSGIENPNPTPPEERIYFVDFEFIIDGNSPGVDNLRVGSARRVRFKLNNRFAGGGSQPFVPGSSAFQVHRLWANNASHWQSLRNLLTLNTNIEGMTPTYLHPSPAGQPGNPFGLEYEILSDVPTLSFQQDLGVVNSREFVIEELANLRMNVAEGLRNEAAIVMLEDHLYDWHALLEAYSSLSLPDMIAGSVVASSALRGGSSIDSYALNVNMQDHYDFHAQFDLQDPFTASERLQPNIDAFRAEVSDWIDRPSPGHGYVNYTLTELYELSESAFDLAIGDRYSTPRMLEVDAAEGLISNDIDQEYRMIEIASVTQSSDPIESLVVHPDGSFEFDAGPDFQGIYSFTYTTRAVITDSLETFETNPATVMIKVTQENTCTADLNSDGVLNFFDVSAFLTLYQMEDPLVDLNNDGQFNFFDVSAFLAAYQTGCP